MLALSKASYVFHALLGHKHIFALQVGLTKQKFKIILPWHECTSEECVHAVSHTYTSFCGQGTRGPWIMRVPMEVNEQLISPLLAQLLQTTSGRGLSFFVNCERSLLECLTDEFVILNTQIFTIRVAYMLWEKFLPRDNSRLRLVEMHWRVPGV